MSTPKPATHTQKAEETVKALSAQLEQLDQERQRLEHGLNAVRSAIANTEIQLVAARALHSGLVLAAGGDIDPQTVPGLFLSEAKTPPSPNKVVPMPQGKQERDRRVKRSRERNQTDQPAN